MKDKILFWLDTDFIHFGIAKYLQDKHDCELFSVIDVYDKPKKFFDMQQLVKFQKIWYYDEHPPLEKEKPDLEYLKSFEEKYKINLWQTAYFDRMFSETSEYYKFKTTQVLSLLERACKFSDAVLDEINPDFFVTKMVNMHHNHLFYEVCKAKGIKVLMLVADRFGYRYMISQNANKIDPNESRMPSNDTKKTISELQNYLKQYSSHEQTKQVATNFQVYRWKPIISWFFGFFLSPRNNNSRNHFNHYGETRLKVLVYAMIHVLQKKYRESFLNRNLIREIDDKIPFIYFPLHVYPELSLLIGAPFYTNQIEVIKNIAKSLPMGYKLYVKEHPGMRIRNWRSISFYKQIMNLPNVHLVHPSITTEEIVKKCSLVITITGTTGLEAAFNEKPAIVLSDVNYSILPSVYRLKNIEELPQAIRSSLQRKVDPLDLNNYVNIMEQNSFRFDIVSLYVDFNNRFYGGGSVIDVDIPIEKMKSFLDEHRLTFEQLALEHIKKIKQYKEVNS